MPALDHLDRDAAKRSNAWIPWMFVVGFAVVISANAALIYYAMHSWSGLSDESAFEHGRTYNRVIGEAEQQALLGWKLAIELRPVARGSSQAELVVTASDRADDPLADLRIDATLERPVGARSTVAARLSAAGGGRYSAIVDLPQRGQWDIHVVARRGGDVDEADRRAFLP